MERDYNEFLNPSITNDAVFSRVMSKKKNCLRLLQGILPKLNLTSIAEIQTQKQITLKMLRKGVRFDVWAKGNNGDNFDIEMQTTPTPALLKRALFYSGRMNDEALMQGQHYKDVKDSYVIFLCTFDPFGYNEAKNEVVYSLKNHPEKELDTGRHIIFLNCVASNRDGLAIDGIDFLKCMNKELVVDSNYISDLKEDVYDYVNGKEWRSLMLDFKSIEKSISDEAREKGLAQGIREGIEQGTKQEQVNSVNTIIRMLREDVGYSDKQILDSLEKRYGTVFSKAELERFIQRKK